MASNLVFLSGPHGAGKTTLVKKLQAASPFITMPELKTTTPKFHTEPLERITLKVAQRAIENFEALEIARESPDKVILGNRCIYDGLAYARAYCSLGWIRESEYQKLVEFTEWVFPEDLQSPKAIVLNPPFGVVWDRLQGRWKEEEKKWQEENRAYSRAACQAYQSLRGHPQVLYLEDNQEIEDALEWLGTAILINS